MDRTIPQTGAFESDPVVMRASAMASEAISSAPIRQRSVLIADIADLCDRLLPDARARLASFGAMTDGKL